MGISLGPEVFQTKMEEIFGSLEGCEPLSDDAIVYGKTGEEHDSRLQKAVGKNEQSGLRLNILVDKCHLKKTEMKYFGYNNTKDRNRPNNERVEVILKLKKPENMSDLRTVLGTFNYLGKSIPNTATILPPLHQGT